MVKTSARIDPTFFVSRYVTKLAEQKAKRNTLPKLTMKRTNLSEIHEQAWFPKSMRNDLTDGLQCIFKFGKIYEPIVPRLAKAIRAAGAQRVVDLCSGAGGPWTWLRGSLVREMNSEQVEICLTDKFPNIAAFERE